MSDIAKTRSIVSFGLSFFRLTDHHAKTTSQIQSMAQDDANQSASGGTTQKGRGLHFVVQTYNIMVLCSDSYTVEPLSLRFLVQHGFDFNKQYATGISYYRGNDRVSTFRLDGSGITRNCVICVLHVSYFCNTYVVFLLYYTCNLYVQM